jgi:cob(I)alamin adenosyltransferase
MHPCLLHHTVSREEFPAPASDPCLRLHTFHETHMLGERTCLFRDMARSMCRKIERTAMAGQVGFEQKTILPQINEISRKAFDLWVQSSNQGETF